MFLKILICINIFLTCLFYFKYRKLLNPRLKPNSKIKFWFIFRILFFLIIGFTWLIILLGPFLVYFRELITVKPKRFEDSRYQCGCCGHILNLEEADTFILWQPHMPPRLMPCPECGLYTNRLILN